MNPCYRCKKKDMCIRFCKVKLDYLRHLNKAQRKRKNATPITAAEKTTNESTLLI